LCIHDARNFDEYTQVFAGDTTNKWHFWEERRVLTHSDTCCAKMAGKEETPTCRKKTVAWTNEMIEDLIDFIEIHPIVACEATLTSFWSLI
jgi:hypothetical protein